MICMWLIPALILLLSIFSIRKLYHIYYQLVPYVFHRDEINLPADNFNRNPEMNIGATKEPPYLQGVIPGKEEE